MKRTQYQSNKQKIRVLTSSSMEQAASIAWSFAKTTGIDFQDLLGDSYLSLVKAANDYNPACKTKMNSFAYTCIENGLKSNISKAKEIQDNEVYTDNIPHFYNQENDPARIAEFKNLLDNLSEEAKSVIKLIFESPADIVNSHGITMASIRKYLHKNGMKIDLINCIFNEIKAIF